MCNFHQLLSIQVTRLYLFIIFPLFSGCIARYMNCVIFDMIHSTLNPAILCFTVLHYYSNIELSDHLIVIRSLHKALVQYVNCWCPAPMQVQVILKVGLCGQCINKLRRVIFVSSLVFSLRFLPEEIRYLYNYI